jgi:hypothetical protein
MTRVSNTECDEELRGGVQALVLAHLCQKFDECTTIVTLGDLGDRFGAVFHDNQ